VKRVLICSIILVVIVISSVVMLFSLKSYNKKLTEKINFALASWHEENKAETLEKVKDLKAYWEKYYIRVSFIVQSCSKRQNRAYKLVNRKA